MNETATVAEHRGSVCRTTPHRGAGKSHFNVLPGRVGLTADLLKRGEDDATLDAQVDASRETVLQVIAGGITSKIPGLGDAVDKVLVDAAFDDFQDTQDANDQLKDEFEQRALVTLPGNSGNGLDVNHPNRSEFNNARQNGQG